MPIRAVRVRTLSLALALFPAIAAAEVRSLNDKVVNGAFEWNLPSVVALLKPDGSGFCSGTLVGCQTVLTAAHCFCGDPATGNQLTGSACAQRADLLNPANVFVFAQHAGFFGVSNVAVNPNYQFMQQGDLAILRLGPAVSGLSPSPLNLSGRVGKGTQGVISGFGRAGGSAHDFGLKRSGLVSTATCTTVPDSSHVCWNFTDPLGPVGTDSNTCQGDSGGPLFVVSGGALHVAGVTSGGPNPTCLPPDQGFQADSFVNAAWIQSQAGADLGASSCGSLPSAGSAAAPILAGAGVLSASNPEDRFTFTLPSGATRLRLALNGDGATAAGDFDLYVKPGAAPSTNDFLCKSDFAGPFEFCEVASPAAGEWHVLVDRFEGLGAYQLTVTPYFSPTGSGPCVANATTLCLNNGRFKVQVVWQTGEGQTGFGQAVSLSPDTGYFWFFNSANVEMIIKVLNACAFGRYWVFAGGLTNVQAVINVTDTQTGELRTYLNPQGTAFQPIQDTSAFATCP